MVQVAPYVDPIGDHGPEWVHVNNFDPTAIMARAKEAREQAGNTGARAKKRRALDVLCAYDIETAIIPGTTESLCYHWQAQIGIDTPYTVYGRTLEETRILFDKLAAFVGEKDTLVIYVHNLYYEYEYLTGIYQFKPEDVFAVRPRRVAKCELYDGAITLKCSYLLTNMGLGAWTEKMHVAHPKLDGEEFDHTLVRYPWTPLHPQELAYCRHDVLGLVEALQVQLDTYGDTLQTVPLTSTGYVRRDVKRTMKNWSHWALVKMQPNPTVYTLLREAFRGGDTHANRYYAGQILEHVGSADRSSSYPDVICNRKFPMGPFRRELVRTPKRLEKLIADGKAVLVRLEFDAIEIRDQYDGAPYISWSKCRGQRAPAWLDNGRLLQHPGTLEMTLTDIDYKIIKRQYKWAACRVLDLWYTHYDYLPDILRNLVIKYYTDKTELKGVEGLELYYGKSKALLNSIYGMMGTDPCKVDTIYTGDPNYEEDGIKYGLWKPGEEDIPGKLEKAARWPFVAYQWGVWVCALSREELRTGGIDLAGDRAVYWDTDSIKYVGDLDLAKYNRAKIKASKFNSAYATDPAGTTHYMGVFESEGTYDKFITLGAKKYAYIINGKLGVTVSGVSKKYGPAELEAAGGLDAFRRGMTWAKAGGVDAKYNDATNYDTTIDGHLVHVGPNITLLPSTYTLGKGESFDEYLYLLQSPAVYQKLSHDSYLQEFKRHSRRVNK